MINRILTDEDRKMYSGLIGRMFETCPEMMSRKIADANVQQAFVLDTVLNILGGNYKDKSIISVGSFEDTAFEYLRIKGANIIGIDPIYGYDLHTYKKVYNTKFDIVFSTSVIEHVKNDEEFIADMCDLLLLNGIGIITTDFKNDYKVGDPLPYSDERLYTKYDLNARLRGIIQARGCDLLEEPNYDNKDNFVYQGHHYSFATFVFKRNIECIIK